MNKIDENIEGVKNNKDNRLNKLIYMDDLKEYLNNKENI